MAHIVCRGRLYFAYYKTRNKWDDETFDLVNWHSVGSVRNQLSDTKKMQTSKIMCGWLPIMHMRQFITGSSQCPGCPCTDETMEHLSQCPNEKMSKSREEAMARIKKLARKRRIPQEVATAFCHIIHTASSGGKHFFLPTFSPAIKKAVEDQKRIGFHLMLRGFLAKSWADALKDSGIKSKVERAMNKLQRLIWMEWIEPIWKTRCDILHRGRNEYDAVKDAKLSADIVWYVEHRRDVLSYHDQFLAGMDLSRLHRMRLKTKKKWMYHLTKARDAYDRECKLLAKGQSTLESFFETLIPSTDAPT